MAISWTLLLVDMILAAPLRPASPPRKEQRCGFARRQTGKIHVGGMACNGWIFRLPGFVRQRGNPRDGFRSPAAYRTIDPQGEKNIQITINERVAVITGGSKGLGLAMARRFAESGAKVAILARR